MVRRYKSEPYEEYDTDMEIANGELQEKKKEVISLFKDLSCANDQISSLLLHAKERHGEGDVLNAAARGDITERMGHS